MRYTLMTIIALLVVASCDPVRRIQRSEERRQAVAAFLISQGICEGDTIVQVVRDTTITHDTTGIIYIYTDTSFVHDTAYITRDKLRNITKTIRLHDTVRLTVTDIAAMDVLEKEWRKCQQESADMQGEKATMMNILAVLAFLLAIAIIVLIKR